VRFVPMRDEDSQFLYELRTEPTAAQWFPGNSSFTYESHLRFLEELRKDPERVQWTLWDGEERVGFLRADRRKILDANSLIEGAFECSAIIRADKRGQGYLKLAQKVMLPQIFEMWSDLNWNVGSIFITNTPCIRAMEALGKRLLYMKSEHEGVWAISRAEVMRWVTT